VGSFEEVRPERRDFSVARAAWREALRSFLCGLAIVVVVYSLIIVLRCVVLCC